MMIGLREQTLYPTDRTEPLGIFRFEIRQRNAFTQRLACEGLDYRKQVSGAVLEFRQEDPLAVLQGAKGMNIRRCTDPLSGDITHGSRPRLMPAVFSSL